MSVARRMVELGIRADSDKKLYVGDVSVSDTALANSVGVDRRVVRHVVEQILDDPELSRIFTHIKPIGSSLIDVADQLGFNVLIVSSYPHRTGVISSITSVLSEHKVVVRQALADDPDLVPDPRLTLVVDGHIPPEALDRIRSLDFVKALTIA